MSKKAQNHYSPEEMIRAAQSRRKEGEVSQAKTSREVITQEDGTKVVRVRKKRRKSGSSHELLDSQESGKKFSLRFLWFGLGALGLVLVTLVGFSFFKTAYFNSPTHVAAVEQTISKRTGFNARMEGHKFGPTSSLLSALTLESVDPSAPYFKVQASKIAIPHRPESIVVGPLRGEPLEVQSAQVAVYYDESPPAALKETSEALQESPYAHNSAAVERVNFLFHTTQDTVGAALKGASAKLFVNNQKETQVLLKGGLVENVSGLPSYLETATCLLKGKELHLKSLKLSNQSYGFLEIEGRYSLSSKQPQSLSAQFSNLRLEGLSAAVDHFLEARVSSTQSQLTVSPLQKDYRITTQLTPSSNGIALKNFQFLNTLGTKFGDLNYPFVSFRDEALTNAVLTKQSLTLSGLNLEKQGFLAVEGSLQIFHQSGALKGNLNIGVPALKVSQAYPNANQERWTVRKGYVWFEIALSGDSTQPRDTFAEVFMDLVEL